MDPHPSLLKRKIIHVDMDAFFAAVETRDNPSLKGKPIVVGGLPTARGVVSTASYEARKFGIHSAMACSQAQKLCPSVIFVPPRFDAYQEVSNQIRTIFREYTDLVEPMSLDEAYLDVTQNKHDLYAVKIAQEIKRKVFETTTLTCSVGVAPNKMIAKIASDANKPNGITVVLPDQVLKFVEHLPLRKISGVGPVTERRLAQAGFKVCSDVWKYSLDELEEKFETSANWLWEISRGIDESPVDISYERKSLGHEQTFPQDILDKNELIKRIEVVAAEVCEELKERNLQGRTITLKVKYANFEQITRAQSIKDVTNKVEDVSNIACQLVEKTEIGKRKVRLIGVSVSNLVGETLESYN